MLCVATILAIILSYGLYSVAIFVTAARRSAPLVAATAPFTSQDASHRFDLLVVGDSLAVGVGSVPEQTIAGRLGKVLDATVENYAKSGAVTNDLREQLARAQKEQYDLIMIIGGANDVIQLKSLARAEKNMEHVLVEARKRSSRVVFLTAGNIGDAPLWPSLWARLYSRRTLDLRSRFVELAHRQDTLYVDLYSRGDMFSSDPHRFYASDELHLTADGYEKWFNVIREEIQARWPELQ